MQFHFKSEGRGQGREKFLAAQRNCKRLYTFVSGQGCRNRPDYPDGVCESWAREGHCDGNADLMNQFCTPECCDITQSTTSTTQTTATTGNI